MPLDFLREKRKKTASPSEGESVGKKKRIGRKFKMYSKEKKKEKSGRSAGPSGRGGGGESTRKLLDSTRGTRGEGMGWPRSRLCFEAGGDGDQGGGGQIFSHITFPSVFKVSFASPKSPEAEPCRATGRAREKRGAKPKRRALRFLKKKVGKRPTNQKNVVLVILRTRKPR